MILCLAHLRFITFIILGNLRNAFVPISNDAHIFISFILSLEFSNAAVSSYSSGVTAFAAPSATYATLSDDARTGTSIF